MVTSETLKRAILMAKIAGRITQTGTRKKVQVKFDDTGVPDPGYASDDTNPHDGQPASGLPVDPEFTLPGIVTGTGPGPAMGRNHRSR